MDEGQERGAWQGWVLGSRGRSGHEGGEFSCSLDQEGPFIHLEGSGGWSN